MVVAAPAPCSSPPSTTHGQRRWTRGCSRCPAYSSRPGPESRTRSGRSRFPRRRRHGCPRDHCTRSQCCPQRHHCAPARLTGSPTRRPLAAGGSTMMLCLRGERCARTTSCPCQIMRRPYPRHGGSPPTAIHIGEPAPRIHSEGVNALTIRRLPRFRAHQPALSAHTLTQGKAQSTAQLSRAPARRYPSTCPAVIATCGTSAWCELPKV